MSNRISGHRRVSSSIPKLPDDDSQEIITSVPSTMALDHGKTLPPLPSPFTTKTDDSSSITSSVSTNKSVVGTPLKSDPTISTTTTHVNSTDKLVQENSELQSINGQLKKLQKEEVENDGKDFNSDGATTGVTSFFRSFTGYGPKIEVIETEDKSPVLEDGIHFETDSPTEMLTYRKTSINRGNKKHSRNLSGASEPMSPQTSINTVLTPKISLTPKNEINYNLYVDEKYLDTQFRYATESRNVEFHKLFEEVPSSDRLLDDFSCALSREILLQGRVYISEHYLCFNSSLLGWITTLVISLDEIKKFERKATAGLFHNGIIVETREAKHVFASFISRDQTLNFIETIWSRSISLSLQNNEKSREFESLLSKTSFEGLNNGARLLTEDDLYTIDSDTSDEKLVNGTNSSSDINSEAGEIRAAESGGSFGNTLSKPRNVHKPLKIHSPSTYRHDYEGTKESIMIEKEYKISVVGLFKIMFGNDLTFHKKSMEMNEGMNFTEYTGLHEEKDERIFEYDKKLNYPVGPSSTRVYVNEIVEHLDFNDYVEVLNISKTPNVPSGSAFDCRTRFVISWSNDDMSKLIISYKLNWTGSSWIKSLIESSALSGQQKAAKDMDELLMEEVPKRVADAGEEDEYNYELEEDENKIDETVAVEKSVSVTIASEKPIFDTSVAIESDGFSLSRQLIKSPIGTFDVNTLISFIIAILILQLILIIYVCYANSQLQNKLKIQTQLLLRISDYINL